ncbi:ABC transporter family substrate-binding protein [Actinomyces howellii]|uniref:Nickel-binding periplasmic protein n=1 Tax=Actinomyces howellii TaxID=52771 RepID=A0A448HJA4_9ACTO|nr:ABC transporter family substrate-binding protein [Actinomyces howellii]VEG29796.1 Nickel-binding periplasmic protein precursor [Actinomyces howellii]
MRKPHWTAFETTWKANNGQDTAYKPSSTDGYERIPSVSQGATPKQAVVTFNGAFAWWQGLFNLMLHPAVSSAELFDSAYLNQLRPEYGAGPYKVSSVDFQQGSVVFVPNEAWWGDPGKLESVTCRVMEAQASLNAFLNGEVDVAAVVTKDSYTKVKAMDGVTIRTGRLPFTILYMLNSESDGLDDARVREAIFRSIDRTTWSKVRYQGIDYSETPPGSFLLFPFQEGYEDNFSKACGYDPEKAAALLEEAGWAKNSSGIYEKDGTTLSLRLPLLGDDETMKAVTTALQSMLKDNGIEVTIQARATSEFSSVYTNKDFDIFAMSFAASDPFGVAYFKQIYGSDSTLNLSGTGTPELDEKIAALQDIADETEQIKAANELEVEALKLFGIIPMANGPSKVAVKDGLVNVGAVGFGRYGIAKQLIGWKA